MKKLITFVFAIVITLPCLTQIKGINLKDAVIFSGNNSIVYEKLMVIETIGKNFYTIIYTQDPIGIRKCIEKTIELVTENGLSFDEPDYDYSYFGKNVDGLGDYYSLYVSLTVNASQVKKGWDLPDHRIALFLTKNMCYIMICEK